MEHYHQPNESSHPDVANNILDAVLAMQREKVEGSNIRSRDRNGYVRSQYKRGQFSLQELNPPERAS